ncbi:hypothetical protein OU995_04140 [Roseateles sp. SL47]|uniref:hypothetical protein n=1 Tax=Roseateles sp. SL47 TaxID=2995138 RepID=UPI00226FFD97|nr:hypothetical protein [Roseateles sp. SL47]WAC73933.1 hypothetical protein OU995_04140 [Roseateles sp. SL47]
MRWYVNDASLQGQFGSTAEFVEILKELLALRRQYEHLRQRFYVTSSLSSREVRTGLSVAQLFQQPDLAAQKRLVLSWLNSAGPFVEEDRTPEPDDYFECLGHDVTEGGLGEGARRVKSAQKASTFSFVGSTPSFAASPLTVLHGIPDDRRGSYDLVNHWTIPSFRLAVQNAQPQPINWRQLVEGARQRFPHLCLPDSLYTDDRLAREAFDSIISDSTLMLLECLNTYMEKRHPDGSESPDCQEIIQQFFTGDRARFSGESETNRVQHRRALTFPDPENPACELLAHWHGKISHRFFRLHFEWPVPAPSRQLKVLYLGPKLTKA